MVWKWVKFFNQLACHCNPMLKQSLIIYFIHHFRDYAGICPLLDVEDMVINNRRKLTVR